MLEINFIDRTQKEDMNWRNSKIHTYYDSMEAMTNLSFLSIRMGKHLIDKIPNNKNKKTHISIIHSFKKSLLNIYQISNPIPNNKNSNKFDKSNLPT